MMKLFIPNNEIILSIFQNLIVFRCMSSEVTALHYFSLKTTCLILAIYICLKNLFFLQYLEIKKKYFVVL